MLFTAPPDELVFPMIGPDSSERTDLPCDDHRVLLIDISHRSQALGREERGPTLLTLLGKELPRLGRARGGGRGAWAVGARWGWAERGCTQLHSLQPGQIVLSSARARDL
jgi:hypothetical protein